MPNPEISSHHESDGVQKDILFICCNMCSIAITEGCVVRICVEFLSCNFLRQRHSHSTFAG